MAKKKNKAASRMSTRGTGEGTSGQGNRRNKTGMSPRGRTVSISSEEEEEEKLRIPRKPRRKKQEDSSENDEADEEDSSRESSRRPLVRKMLTKLPGKKAVKKVKEGHTSSGSRDSSGSQEPSKSTNKKGISVQKEALPIRRVLTPGSKVGKVQDDSSDESSEKGRKRAKREEDKRKRKQSLKDLQDKLLEEAKNDIKTASTNSSTPKSATPLSTTSNNTESSDERITISQRTGYIQVKPRKSIDQMEEMDSLETVGQAIAQSHDAEGNSTPPRRSLFDQIAFPNQEEKNTSHLPIGVMGASRLSMKSSSPAQVPMHQHHNMHSAMNNQQVPYTQPLMINTGLPNINTNVQQTVNAGVDMPPHEVQATTAPPAGIFMQRMPAHAGSVPMQMRAANNQQVFNPVTQHMQVPGMTVPVQHPTQNMHGFNAQNHQDAAVNVPYTQEHHIMTMPPNLANTCAPSTQVTSSNTQPKVSPGGPPTLYPQTKGQNTASNSHLNRSNHSVPAKQQKESSKTKMSYQQQKTTYRQPHQQSSSSKSNQQQKGRLSSFRVDNEAGPYAFESEQVETNINAAYRKPSPADIHRHRVQLKPVTKGNKKQSLARTNTCTSQRQIC